MAQEKNGRQTINWILSSILIAFVLTMAGWFANELLSHEALAGHPVVVERVDRLIENVEHIRQEQIVQGRTLNEIKVLLTKNGS